MTFPVVGSNIPGSYQISNSLRFNDNDNPYLRRTPASAGNRKTWTLSCWFKKCETGLNHTLFSTTGTQDIRFASNERLLVYGESKAILNTNRLFRDASSWYHIVIACDTTQATASNRVKMYINGVQETSFETNSQPSQNYDWNFNNTVQQSIGERASTGGLNPHGYLAEFNWIDGQQLSPTDFGEFDLDSGVWKPKQYAGTYGTNGFYLKFNNTGNMGEDSSGNDNTFTPTNLSGTTDVTTDTPTNNFATINALQKTSGSQLLSEGNLEHRTTGNWMYLPANMGASSGKWYAEIKLIDPSSFNVGVMQLGGASDTTSLMNTNNTILGSNTAGDAWALYGSGADKGTYKNNNAPNFGNIATSFPSNIVANDIIMIAMDTDNQKIWFGVNGSWDNSGDPVAGTNPMPVNTSMIAGKTFTFASGPEQGTQQWNFGNPPFSISSGNSDDNGYGNFEYAPPSGYLALCTQNLATELSPTIDDGSAYFHTQLYTGNGTDDRSITNDANAGDFSPDFLWVKNRTSANGHGLVDTTRGATKVLRSQATNAEETEDNAIQTFQTDGFQIGTSGLVNTSGNNYVAWQWKANAGSTSSNTDGTKTTTVQASTTSGFSIVTYNGLTNGQTIGHGLGGTPEMIIFKSRNVATSWHTWHQGLGDGNNYLLLNTTGAKNNDSYEYISNIGSSTVQLQGSSSFNQDTVGYFFRGIEGYSKFGSYTGNGSSDGPFVYTGFKPAFTLIKRTNATQAWVLHDSARAGYINPTDNYVYANATNVEAEDIDHDYLSNGFKIRSTFNDTNASGGTYIYMAFAQNPFVSLGAVPVTAL